MAGATEFRANPAYDLVLLDRLATAERAALADLAADPDLYGVLCPRSPGLGVQAVSRETALLFLTMRTAGPLPDYLSHVYGRGLRDAICRLVLTGILEAKTGDGYVTGAAATNLFGDTGSDRRAGARDALHRLTLAAVEYGRVLEVDDPRTLSVRLYCFGRRPIGPVWQRRFPTPQAVLSYLGLGGGPAARTLGRAWSSAGPDELAGWSSWRARKGRPMHDRRTSGTHKLYVSPRLEEAGSVMPTVLEVATRLRVPQFKVGATAGGVLRPDKIVLYLPDFDHLGTVAHALADRLAGCPAHGVPFTAAVTPDGLLSWGVDPPVNEAYVRWEGAESWRLHVTNRLAAALLAARAAGTEVDAWQFAQVRLRADGVDPQSWAPVAWRGELP